MDNDLQRNTTDTNRSVRQDPSGRPMGDKVETGRPRGGSIESGRTDLQDDDLQVGDDLIRGESTPNR